MQTVLDVFYLLGVPLIPKSESCPNRYCAFTYTLFLLFVQVFITQC